MTLNSALKFFAKFSHKPLVLHLQDFTRFFFHVHRNDLHSGNLYVFCEHKNHNFSRCWLH